MLHKVGWRDLENDTGMAFLPLQTGDVSVGGIFFFFVGL